MDSDILINLLIVVIIVGILAVIVLFYVAQQNTLKAIQPENRLMRPGEVWLQLIPIYGLFWQFTVVNRISDSIRLEIESWHVDSILGPDAGALPLIGDRPTRDIGVACCILKFVVRIPLLGSIAVIPMLVCVIVYWSKLVQYKRMIEQRVFA